MYILCLGQYRDILCAPLSHLQIKMLIYPSKFKNVVLESKGPLGDFLMALSSENSLNGNKGYLWLGVMTEVKCHVGNTRFSEILRSGSICQL